MQKAAVVFIWKYVAKDLAAVNELRRSHDKTLGLESMVLQTRSIHPNSFLVNRNVAAFTVHLRARKHLQQLHVYCTYHCSQFFIKMNIQSYGYVTTIKIPFTITGNGVLILVPRIYITKRTICTRSCIPVNGDSRIWLYVWKYRCNNGDYTINRFLKLSISIIIVSNTNIKYF